MKHIFIIGSKGIPASYGGFETFVDKLVEYNENENIQYHISCLNAKEKEFSYNSAHCFSVKVPDIGPAKAVIYDLCALKKVVDFCKNGSHIKEPIVYVLACRIGPFIKKYVKEIHRLGGKVYVNPDGHEWKRAKWNWMIRRYWKLSEKLMIRNADLVVCDSRNIEKYIHADYDRYSPKTCYIAYGTEISREIDSETSEKVTAWLQEKSIQREEFYLIVGRFVPENNYETIIREYMKSLTSKKLVIITNANEAFLKELNKKLLFEKDSRICFVGTVYDKKLLAAIRQLAYGYIHGHEVGGTNPSLLEAMAHTKLNLLLDVSFNREVAENSAVYWNKSEGCLSNLLNVCDEMELQELQEYDTLSRNRMKEMYSWEFIESEYEKIWLQ